MKLLKIILNCDKDFISRDSEKLRGYFGKICKENKMFHNHLDGYQFNYDFSYIQYKIIDKKPCIIAIEKGTDALLEIVDSIKEINIGNEIIKVTPEVILKYPNIEIGDDFFIYKFESTWLALNDTNFIKYKNNQLNLDKILTANILEFLKMCNIWTDKKIIVKGDFQENLITQKDTKIIGFIGTFKTNIKLPDDISLGKRKSIGMGRIKYIGKE